MFDIDRSGSFFVIKVLDFVFFASQLNENNRNPIVNWVERMFVFGKVLTLNLCFIFCVCAEKGYDYIERLSDGIATTDELQVDISDTLVKNPEEIDDIQHAFEDNRFIDHVSDHFVNTGAANRSEHQNEHFEDDEPELPNKIDFAEKREFSKFSDSFTLIFEFSSIIFQNQNLIFSTLHGKTDSRQISFVKQTKKSLMKTMTMTTMI